MKINFVIPCLLGLEKLIADEMKDLGAENVISENGRVLFSGDEHLLARANICSEKLLKAIIFQMRSSGGKKLPSLTR